MMNAVILLIFVKVGYGGGLTSIEFADMAACERAASVVVAEWDGMLSRVQTKCIER